MAQWSKFSMEVAQKIVDLVRAGSTRANAAARVRVSDRTVKSWVAKGRKNVDALEVGTVDDLDEYGLFVLELQEAEAQVNSFAEGVLLKAMAKGGDVGVRAATWWLKHRGGPEYRVRVEQVGKDGESVYDGARDRLAARVAEKLAALGGKTEPVQH